PQPEELVQKLVEEEAWRQVLTSLVVCLFAREVYKPEVVSEALKIAGYDLSPSDLAEIGRKIYREKYRLKVELGFDPDRVSFPQRIFETPTPHGRLDPALLESMRKAYAGFIRSMLAS
ncbi:MAG: aldehyde ferredoxin oxidoreductase C-terminal domain-containing protein, partial [Thermofilum sp.]